MITLQAISSSGDGTYHVTFSFEENKLAARCTCKAASMGKLCKHCFALLAGDVTMLADRGQYSDLTKVAEWAEQSGLMDTCKAILEAEREIELAQKTSRKLKRALQDRIS